VLLVFLVWKRILLEQEGKQRIIRKQIKMWEIVVMNGKYEMEMKNINQCISSAYRFTDFD